MSFVFAIALWIALFDNQIVGFAVLSALGLVTTIAIAAGLRRKHPRQGHSAGDKGTILPSDFMAGLKLPTVIYTIDVTQDFTTGDYLVKLSPSGYRDIWRTVAEQAYKHNAQYRTYSEEATPHGALVFRCFLQNQEL